MLSKEDRVLNVSELKNDTVLIRDVNQLKERLLQEWHHSDQRIIDRAVSYM